MSRSKKTQKKTEFTPIPQQFLPVLENYNDTIRNLYTQMKNADRIMIAENIILVKLLPFGKEYKPMIAINCLAKIPEKEYTYRHPLNMTTLEQYNAVISVLSNPQLSAIMKAVNNVNTEVIAYNTQLNEAKKAQKKKMDQKEEDTNGEET